MPSTRIIEDNISIPANTVNDNVIVSNPSLRRFLRAPFLCEAELVAVISAAGLNIDMDYGSKNVVNNYRPRIDTVLNEMWDTVNDQFYPSKGDQLVLRATNTTGGALSLRYRITLYPLYRGQRPQPDKRVTGNVASIAAGAVDTQLLDGNRYERPPVASQVRIFMTGSAAGLTRRVEVGTDTVAPPSAISPANRTPQDPMDLSVAGVQVPKDTQALLPVSNPTGGAISVFWRAEFLEAYRK